MLRRKVMSLATVVSMLASGIAAAQEATTPPPAPPPAAEPAPAAPPPAAEPAAPAAEPAAPAAAAPAAPEERVEEITVTGTRIRRKDLTTPAPVTVISKETIQASGKVSLGDFLQSLPEQGNAVNTQVNNGGSGATRVDIRGLGNQRTLVLVNGRRMVSTGTGLQTGQGVDLNTIPTAAIERVEILKDGASAVYGSDAIGGVVNVITKKGFANSEVNAYAGTSSRGDGEIYDVNFTTGTRGERGSVLFSAGYTEQNPVWAGERDFSKYQLEYDFATGEVNRIGSSRAPSGRVFEGGAYQEFFAGPDGEYDTADDVANPDYQPGNGTWQALLASGHTPQSFTFDPSVPATYRPFAGGGIAPAGDLYNFQPENYNITPNRRINLFSIGDAEVFEGVRAYFEGEYTNRSSKQQLAPEPLIIGTGGADVLISRDSFYNPFGRDFDNLTLRMSSVGPRIQEQDVDTFRVVTGVDGVLPESAGPLSGWAWDTSLNYGRTVGTWVYRGNLIASRLQAAVGPSFQDPTGAVHCGNPGPDAVPGTLDDVIIPNCVPVDLFHGSQALTPEMVNFISFTGPNRLTNAMTAFQANTSGELFTLMADRPVGLALGYEFRHESGAFVPDPINQKGDGTGGAVDETRGAFDVHEGYVELSVPIVSGMPFAEDLEASLAARAFDYSTFGSDITYKFGARWRIIPDVTLRGTFSTAFRAPSITDLFLGASDNFPSASDPCAGPGITATLPGPDGVPGTGDDVPNPLFTNCGAAVNNADDSTQLRSTNSGNPELEPETADIFTAGIVVQPRWVKDLSVTVDFYRIKIDNSITTYGVPYILNQCYVGGDTSFCGLVDRDATNRVTNVDDINVNVGGDDTRGLDFAVRYGLPTPVGRFAFAFDGTYLLHYEREIAGAVIDGRGNFDLGNLIGGTGGVYPKFKALTGVNWGLGGFGAGATVRYVGSFTECADADGFNFGGLCSDNPTGLSREVSAYYLWDTFVSYNFKHPVGTANVAVGVRNLFDQGPPVVYNAFTPTSDPTAYDFMGRFFYGTVSQRF